MILQALNEYYQRKTDYEAGSLPPYGYEDLEIAFVIEITKEGDVVQVLDRREPVGNYLIAKDQRVPQPVDRPGKDSWKTAFLLWDYPRYVLALRHNDEDDDELSNKRYQAFIDRLLHTFPDPTVDDGVNAVYKFLIKKDVTKIQQASCWDDICASTKGITFQLQGDNSYVCQRPQVITAVIGDFLASVTSENSAQCLVTGTWGEIANLHRATPIPKSKATAKIISFNEDSFRSYGKKQGKNSPVSKRAVFAYTTSINYLLSTKNSSQKQCIQIGNTHFLFWSQNNVKINNSEFDQVESLLPNCLGEAPEDDPDRDVRAVRSLYNALDHGQLDSNNGQSMFYVLGLAANSARISVVFWEAAPLIELATRLRQHFDQLGIIRDEKKFPSNVLPIYSSKASENAILNSLVFERKSKNIPDNLPGEVIRSILQGHPYPRTLQNLALRRIRSERDVTFPQAAILKACINQQSKPQESLTVSLDENNTLPAYRLGRLFAVLERIQEEANPNTSTTIRDTYWGAASSTPERVFPLLINLSNKHLRKIRRDKPGRAVNIEKQIGEIIQGISSENPFPPSFPYIDQGRFAIGFYHQKQDPSTYKTQGETE